MFIVNFPFLFSPGILFWNCDCRMDFMNWSSTILLSYLICVCVCVCFDFWSSYLNLFLFVCHTFLLSWVQYFSLKTSIVLPFLKILFPSYSVNWSQSFLMQTLLKFLVTYCSWDPPNESEFLRMFVALKWWLTGPTSSLWDSWLNYFFGWL